MTYEPTSVDKLQIKRRTRAKSELTQAVEALEPGQAIQGLGKNKATAVVAAMNRNGRKGEFVSRRCEDDTYAVICRDLADDE